jgi:hypothetical protein
MNDKLYLLNGSLSGPLLLNPEFIVSIHQEPGVPLTHSQHNMPPTPATLVIKTIAGEMRFTGAEADSYWNDQIEKKKKSEPKAAGRAG